MLYFLFLIIQFIRADENIDRNDEPSLLEQKNSDALEKSLSSNENNKDLQQQENTTSNNSDISPHPTTNPPSNFPHQTLKRMNATNNIPKYSLESESTTIGLDHPESLPEQTPKVNPLQRRNAKYNLPKVELDDEIMNSQEEKNTNQVQSNSDISNKEEFYDNPSENLNVNYEKKISTEEGNYQIKTEDKAEKTQVPIGTPTPSETDIPTPTQTEQPTPTQTENPTPTQTEEPTDETLTDFEELTDDILFQPSDTFPNKANINKENEQNDQKQYSDKDTENQSSKSDLNSSVKKKLPKFHIVSISPQTVSTRGDEKIEITMNTTLDGPPFIRFGDNKIVHGRHSKKDLTVKCRTPRLQEGEIEVFVSIDKIKWSEPFILIVVADEAELPWIFVGCAGLAIIAVSLMVSKLICGKRAVPKKKKSSKYRDDGLLNIMAPNYSSNNLRKRSKVPTEV